MVVATNLVHHRHRRDGGDRPSSAEFVSIYRRLDFAALDRRHRTRVANGARRTGARARSYSRGLAWIEHSSMGGGVVPGGFIFSAPALVRSGSQPTGRHLL